MAKKRVIKKKVSRRPAKRRIARKKVSRRTKQPIPKNRSKLALRDLILFAVLSFISFILYSVSGIELYKDTFYLLYIIFLFIAIAFLIVFLALTFSKGKVKKRR